MQVQVCVLAFATTGKGKEYWEKAELVGVDKKIRFPINGVDGSGNKSAI